MARLRLFLRGCVLLIATGAALAGLGRLVIGMPTLPAAADFSPRYLAACALAALFVAAAADPDSG